MIRRLLLVVVCLSTVATLAACGSEAGDPAAPGDLPSATSPPATDEPDPGRPTTTRRSGTSSTRSTTTRRETTTTTAGGGGGSIPATNPYVKEFVNHRDLTQIGFTEAQRLCAAQQVDTAIAEGRTNGEDRNVMAGAVGGALVNCVGSAEVARLFGALIRTSYTGEYTEAQLACIDGQFAALPGTNLAVLIGGSLVGDDATTDTVIEPINLACGTTL